MTEEHQHILQFKQIVKKKFPATAQDKKDWLTFIQKKENTEISFDINFEIENRFLNIIMEKSFQFGLNKIADSFQKRANDLFKGK